MLKKNGCKRMICIVIARTIGRSPPATNKRNLSRAGNLLIFIRDCFHLLLSENRINKYTSLQILKSLTSLKLHFWSLASLLLCFEVWFLFEVKHIGNHIFWKLFNVSVVLPCCFIKLSPFNCNAIFCSL